MDREKLRAKVALRAAQVEIGDDETFDAFFCALHKALKTKYPGAYWYIERPYGAHLILCLCGAMGQDSKLLDIPWSRGADGAFTFGEATEVERKVIYPPKVETEEMDAAAVSARLQFAASSLKAAKTPEERTQAQDEAQQLVARFSGKHIDAAGLAAALSKSYRNAA